MLRMEETIDRVLIHPGEVVPVAEVPEEFRPFVGVYIANFASFENERFEWAVKGGKLALDIPSQMVFELLGRGRGRQSPVRRPSRSRCRSTWARTGRPTRCRSTRAGCRSMCRGEVVGGVEQSKAGEAPCGGARLGVRAVP